MNLQNLKKSCGFVTYDIQKYCSINYRPQRSWGQVMFLQVCVILFTGGEYLTRYMPPPRDQVHPPDQVHPQYQVHPLEPGTPRDQEPGTLPLGPGTPRDQAPQDQVHPRRTRYTPAGPGTPPQDQVHPHRTRYTPRDQVHPPSVDHAGRYGLRAGGTHPTGMQSCCTKQSLEVIKRLKTLNKPLVMSNPLQCIHHFRIGGKTRSITRNKEITSEWDFPPQEHRI